MDVHKSGIIYLSWDFLLLYIFFLLGNPIVNEFFFLIINFVGFVELLVVQVVECEKYQQLVFRDQFKAS